MTRQMTALVAACGSVLMAGSAQALDWNMTAGVDARWFDWREYQSQDQLLMERGPLGAPVLGFRLQQQALYASVETLWGGGVTRYDGHLQSGPPYEANAWEEMLDTEWRLGWQEARGGLHLGFMQRDWRRFIDGSATVSSAEERYRWRLVTFGGEAALPHSSNWHVAMNIGLPVSSYQKVYNSGFDDFSLEPGDGFFWRLSFPFYSSVPDSHGLIVEPYYQEQRMERSDSLRLTLNGVPQNQQVYQPASVRRELGLTLRWRFGPATQ